MTDAMRAPQVPERYRDDSEALDVREVSLLALRAQPSLVELKAWTGEKRTGHESPQDVIFDGPGNRA